MQGLIIVSQPLAVLIIYEELESVSMRPLKDVSHLSSRGVTSSKQWEA